MKSFNNSHLLFDNSLAVYQNQREVTSTVWGGGGEQLITEAFYNNHLAKIMQVTVY
jgi:hypothetical protein